MFLKGTLKANLHSKTKQNEILIYILYLSFMRVMKRNFILNLRIIESFSLKTPSSEMKILQETRKTAQQLYRKIISGEKFLVSKDLVLEETM